VWRSVWRLRGEGSTVLKHESMSARRILRIRVLLMVPSLRLCRATGRMSAEPRRILRLKSPHLSSRRRTSVSNSHRREKDESPVWEARSGGAASGSFGHERAYDRLAPHLSLELDQNRPDLRDDVGLARPEGVPLPLDLGEEGVETEPHPPVMAEPGLAMVATARVSITSPERLWTESRAPP
jgi:hypothetical protein